MGLNGEVYQGIKDEASARAKMAEYLKDIRYAMPDEADQAKNLDAHLKRAAAEEDRQRIKRERAARRI